MTPVGPHLTQPAQYKPSKGRLFETTRPSRFGIVPEASSKRIPSSAMPGIDSALYPTLRKARDASIVEKSPVVSILVLGLNGSPSATNLLRTRLTDANLDGDRADPLNRVGERRKSNDQTLALSPCRGLFAFARSCDMRLGTRASLTSGPGSSPLGSGSNPTSGSSKSSRTSLTVNEACNGPRRPTTWTRLISLFRRASKAASVISVSRSFSTLERRTRATSRATLPLPTMTAVSDVSSLGARCEYSGKPLYQPTKARAEKTPSRSSPGMPSCRSRLAPYAKRIAS